jgi:tRNA threonylcarbamoyladenosine biosynthesis protein TsaE
MKKELSFDGLEKAAIKFAECLKTGDIVVISGELGTGKTTFVKNAANALGVKENVKSPTFNIVSEYNSSKGKLIHYDVYRLSCSEEIYDTGFEDYLDSNSIIFIEWGEMIESELPEEYIKVEMEYSGEETRMLRICVPGNEKREEELNENVYSWD